MAPLKLIFPIVSLLACLRAPASLAAAEAGTATSEPPLSWVDPDTGHRVLRLTREPGSASLYFNQNGYTPDGQRMVYTTGDGISVINLKSLECSRIVEGRVRTIEVGHRTATVYYLRAEDPAAPASQALYSTNLDTGETRRLAPLPRRGGIVTINADETLAAGTYIEGDGEDYNSRQSGQSHSLDQPRNKGEMMERRLAARLPLVLFTVDLRSGETKALLNSTDWVNHLLFSPTDPTLLMYCHEGPWHKVDRVWNIRTTGGEPVLIHRRTMGMEIAGHEWWSADGGTVWYDLQTPKGQVFWVAGLDLRSGERTWFSLQRNEWSIHFNTSRDGSLLCGDGGDPGQVAKAPDGRWIYLFHPERIKDSDTLGAGLVHPGVLHAEKLVNMSRHEYHLEPNVSFSPDSRYVIFRSNMFGPTYVFAVEVEKAR
jgi:oligogalacturonide lyase